MTDETIEPNSIKVNEHEIIIGSFYINIKTKNLYRVLCFTNIDCPSEHYLETIVYLRLHDNKMFSRPSADWFRNMKLTIPLTEEYKK